MSDEKQDNIPLFVNYGTNRLVLDIPVRIRTKHEFDIYSAFDKAIENQIDFRTFFEWFRNQEDYENECKVQNADLEFTDKSLEAVKKAMLAMLDECTNLRVARKPRLEMVSLRARSPNNAIVHFSPSDNCDTFNPTPFLSTFISNLGFLATLKFVHSSNMASIAFTNNRSMTGVGFTRKDFEVIKNEKNGGLNSFGFFSLVGGTGIAALYRRFPAL